MKKVGAIFILLLINANLLSAKIKVLLIDGQNNHNWKATTPVMVDALEKFSHCFHFSSEKIET